VSLAATDGKATFFVAASHRSAKDYVEIAQLVEELGFDGLSVADHVLVPAVPPTEYPYSDDGRPPFDGTTPWPDALMVALSAALSTTRLVFMTGVYILPLRHPLIVARAAATFDELAPGRLQLGVGVGWMPDEFTALGVDFSKRGALTDESIEVLRKLWHGGVVEHAGPHYPLQPLHFEPHPPEPIPILVGGHSRRALERAARLADGYIAAPGTTDDLLAQVDEIRKLRSNFGRSDKPFVVRARPQSVRPLDDYRRLLDAGINSFVIGALRGSLDDVRAVLEDAVAEIIEPLRFAGDIS
jgi:probable F420-dependent oxidoreductase